MKGNRAQYLLVFGYWAAVATIFWLLQDRWPTGVVFPLTGAAWMAGPLLLTRLRTKPLLIGSGLSLLAGASTYQAMIWAAMTFAGFLGSVFLQLDPGPPGAVAANLFVEGLWFVFGGAFGALVGLMIRGGRSTGGFEG